jgi:hypothetical protein
MDSCALILDWHSFVLSHQCILADSLMLDWVTSEHLVPTLDYYSGNRINIDGTFCLPCFARKRASYRYFQVYSLFGGKKDKDENGDEAPSKVSS